MTAEPRSTNEGPPAGASPSLLDAPGPSREADRAKAPVAWYWWLVWTVLLAMGMFVFYVLFTPVWIGIRLAAWVSERSPRARRRS